MSNYVGERASQKSVATTNLTEPIPVTVNFNQGNLAVLCFGARDTSATGITITDTKGNTWSVDKAVNPNNNFALIGSSLQNKGTLTTLDTVTINFTIAPNSGRYSVLEEFSNILSSNYNDGSSSNSSAGASNLSGGVIIPSVNGDLLIDCWLIDQNPTVNFNAAGTIGTYSNFTTKTLSSNSGGFTKTTAFCYQILSSGSGVSQQANISLSTSHSLTGLSVAYKAAPVSTKKGFKYMPFRDRTRPMN